jgi:leucine dehydrogenase
MVVIRGQTKNVTGLPPKDGGGGDPSPFTALGVRRGIEACVRHVYGRDLSGIKVAIQGVGHVGYYLAKELHALGAKLTISDIDASRTNRVREELGATVVPNDQIFAQDVDVLAPCALGAILDDATLPQIRAKIIAGAANNQLAETRHGEALHARGVVYAPDYAINAGGLVNVCAEHLGHASGKGYDEKGSRETVLKIHDTILEIVERAKATNVPSYRVADQIVEERLAKVGA